MRHKEPNAAKEAQQAPEVAETISRVKNRNDWEGSSGCLPHLTSTAILETMYAITPAVIFTSAGHHYNCMTHL